MACTFTYNNRGEIIAVKNEDGTPSKLFQDALNRFGDRQKAIDIVAASLDENFLGEPSLQNVLNFVARENRNQNNLTSQQNQDLKNSLISLNFNMVEEFTDKLQQAFYNGEIFTPTETSLTNSGLYSPYEVQTILNDVELQENIKNAIEALNNTDIEAPQYDNFTNVQKLDEFNSFGKLTVVNPYITEQVVVDALGGVQTQNEFDDRLSELEYPTDMTFEQAQEYSKIPHYPPIPTTDTYSAITLGVKAEIPNSVTSALNTLINTPDAIADNNEQHISTLLKTVETGLASVGMDVLGIQNDKPLLRSLQAFLLNPTEANTGSLVAEYNRFFEINDSPKEYTLKLPKNRNYVFSDINKAEDLLLVEDGLIKADENLYIKVRRIPIEELRQIVGEVSEDTEIINVENSEYLEELKLLKTYFGVPMNVNTLAQVVDSSQVTRSNEYLQNDFIADFQIAALKEKQKNSDKWRNFYSNFEINQRGINLKNNDPLTIDTINTYIDSTNPTLKQYSIISKQLPILGEYENSEVSERISAANNPLTVDKLRQESFRIDNETIVVKDANEQFVRVGKRVYESLETQNGLTLYKQLPEANSDYVNYEIKPPTSNINLRDYDYLRNQVEGFTSIKKGKENIIQENFNCI